MIGSEQNPEQPQLKDSEEPYPLIDLGGLYPDRILDTRDGHMSVPAIIDTQSAALPPFLGLSGITVDCDSTTAVVLDNGEPDPLRTEDIEEAVMITNNDEMDVHDGYYVGTSFLGRVAEKYVKPTQAIAFGANGKQHTVEVDGYHEITGPKQQLDQAESWLSYLRQRPSASSDRDIATLSQRTEPLIHSFHVSELDLALKAMREYKILQENTTSLAYPDLDMLEQRIVRTIDSPLPKPVKSPWLLNELYDLKPDEYLDRLFVGQEVNTSKDFELLPETE